MPINASKHRRACEARYQHRVEAAWRLSLRDHSIHRFNMRERKLRIDGSDNGAQNVLHLLGRQLAAQHDRTVVAGSRSGGANWPSAALN